MAVFMFRIMFSKRKRKHFFKYLGGESWRRNPGGRTMENKSCRRHHGREMMEERPSRSREEIMEEESWKRDCMFV